MKVEARNLSVEDVFKCYCEDGDWPYDEQLKAVDTKEWGVFATKWPQEHFATRMYFIAPDTPVEIQY